jgi:hypothetical protein
MQEFTSISVSSYEADTLTALLNEKSGDGWNVVSIVPTGSTVTAYLARDKDEQTAGSMTPDAADAKPDTADAKAAADDTKPAAATAAAAVGAASLAEDDSKSVIDPLTVGASAGDEGKDVDKSAESAIDEPGGWAAGHAAAGAGAADAVTTPAAAEAPASGAATPATTTPASTAAPAAAAATPAAASSASAASTPAASAAPAGWYADPSSRYELRYWDGSQWTEHVSRAGQQFTDPPVA